MTLPVKRSREEEEAYTADCLMLLSKVGRSEAGAARPAGRSFTCKTCNKEFMSFQALGGHRASHNKPEKLARVDGLSLKTTLTSSPAKRKSHECPVCGIEFAIGQALGGHMRRHRATGVKNTNDDAKNIVYPTSTSSTTTNTSSSTVSDELEPRVVKKSRFMIFGVDLSLVEPEKDVKLELGLAGRESPALMGLLV